MDMLKIDNMLKRCLSIEVEVPTSENINNRLKSSERVNHVLQIPYNPHDFSDVVKTKNISSWQKCQLSHCFLCDVAFLTQTQIRLSAPSTVVVVVNKKVITLYLVVCLLTHHVDAYRCTFSYSPSP